MAGTLVNDRLINKPIAPSTPLSQFGNPASFTAAATQQAGDYDQIMKNYQGVLNKSNNSPVGYTPTNFSPIAPSLAQYSQSPDVTSSLSNLSGLSNTGGYDQQGISDLRARGISPIRSIYANAQQNLERAKGLSGGYSPGLNATTAKMAREEADQIGKITTDVNAGIAQNVASNRLSAAPQYAQAAAGANQAQTQSSQNNAAIMNQINQFNAQNALANNQMNSQGALAAAQQNRQTGLGAVNGMTSLYGTTPALTNTFGNQVMQANSANQNQQQINNQKQQQAVAPVVNAVRWG